MRNTVLIGMMVCIAACMAGCSSPSAEEYYQQGRHYRETDEPVEAVRSFLAATQCGSREYEYKGRSFSNIATMCRICERHETAYRYYQKSAEQFFRMNDSLRIAHALNNMAWELAVMGRKDTATLLADSAEHMCPAASLFAKTAETRAAACLYAGEYDSVLLYTQKIPMESRDSVYFEILRAQAFVFLGQNDSALCYARRVLNSTDNPRYIDDVYYILVHCDSTAEADSIRKMAEERTDVRTRLESGDPEWTQAMLIAEEALETQKVPMKPILFLSLSVLFAAVVAVLWFKRCKRRLPELERECRALRQSANLSEELALNDYRQFCTVCNTRLMGIADKLDRRGLTEREIRICVLVLIGLSYTEIAAVLYRAESGIGKDKYLIAKRLGVRTKDLQHTLKEIAEEP
ncbi:MAG: hypothetical protein IKO26_06075 [Paludibacteraceae bacterium]|nr:hypothetical protein [Paludibacteraceae bacterium]